MITIPAIASLFFFNWRNTVAERDLLLGDFEAVPDPAFVKFSIRAPSSRLVLLADSAIYDRIYDIDNQHD
jgi:hypothetical protein